MDDINNFETVIKEIKSYLIRNQSSLNKKTKDFLFTKSLERICDICSFYIRKAIEEKDSVNEEEIPDSTILEVYQFLKRYLLEIKNLSLFSPLNEEEIYLIKKINILFFNWVNLIITNIRDVENLNIEDLKNVKTEINNIENILDGNLTLRELININKILIDRAEKLLSLRPNYFKVSEHFFNALNIATNNLKK